ncbi:MAG TPA: NADP-dependent oxidoreductase [Candidatus Dormibacteraeota bacterium]|jgi:NADPH:quinone reductase-like Zn-dependent oxidoreductase|nr:NADP-dependent oxidoreductase [Candidatus Dormibacteraeota bacterium]
MRAITITRAGGPEVLEVGHRDVREAGPGEIRISVAAAAVNPTDILLRDRGAEGLAPPWVPGMDAAGTVESIGPGVERLHPGDRVMAVVNPRRPEGGAQAELVVIPAASAVTIPEGATLAQAATLPMNGVTAQLGLEQLALARGGTLAVTGGAGLLSSYVIPLARDLGLRVLADASPADEALVRGFGADVVVPRGAGFNDAVRRTVPGGVDGLFDAAVLGSAVFPALRDGGAMAVVRGWAGGEVERGIRIEVVFVRNALERTDWLERLRDMASLGRITLRVAAEYAPEQVVAAQERMAAGGLRGRAIIVF